MISSQGLDIEDTPGDDQIERAKHLQSLGLTQLGGFDAADVLECIEEHLDAPAQSIPAHFFLGLLEGFNRQIGIVRGAVASQTWWLSERRMPWYLTTRPESESRRNN